MSDGDDIQRLQLRIPAEMYEVVKGLADKNFRSANAEILYLVSLGLERAKEHASPEDVREIISEELQSLYTATTGNTGDYSAVAADTRKNPRHK
jgi:hypothetical protein